MGVSPHKPHRGHVLDVYVDDIRDSHPSLSALGVHDARDVVVPMCGPPKTQSAMYPLGDEPAHPV